MSNNVIVGFLLFMICWVAAGSFYAMAVRPVLADKVRYRLFALRDELRFMAATGAINADDRNYEFLERFLCRAVDYCRWFSWTHFLEFMVCHSSDLSRDIVLFGEEAPEELRELRSKAIGELFLIVAINSPVMSMLFGTIENGAKLLARLFDGQAKARSRAFASATVVARRISARSRWLRSKMEEFLQEEPAFDHHSPQAA